MSKSAITLSIEDLENIKSYRYATNGLTPLEIHVFEPFWNFIARLYPDWLAPNAITLCGLIVPFITTFIIDSMYPELTGAFPRWLMALCIFSNFWY